MDLRSLRFWLQRILIGVNIMSELNLFGLIDLVSEKHAELRGEVRQRCIQNGNEDLTPQEYYLMTRLEKHRN